MWRSSTLLLANLPHSQPVSAWPNACLGAPNPSSCWDEAKQGCDGCGQLAPIPLHRLSERVSERVEECQHFCDGIWECKTVCELVCAWAKLEKSTWLYFESSYLIIMMISQNMSMCIGRSFCYSVPLPGEWGDESDKRWKTVFSIGGRGESGVCAIHVGTLETWAVKTSSVDWSQVDCIYIRKWNMFLTKELYSDQRPQMQTNTEVTWYCCFKWHNMLFTSWHPTFGPSETQATKWTLLIACSF